MMNFFKAFYKTLMFSVERFMVRGAFYQLLSVAGFICFISVSAGAIAYFLPESNFSNMPSAVWWAFLRLTDPGYLGDDQGTYIRLLSTILTVLGYVLFLGSLVAILTQGLNRFLSRLESGLINLTDKDHIIILNLTHRTPLILKELLLSKGRVGRFLKSMNARKLRIVILSELVNVKILHDLRAQLGTLWDDSKIILRSGSPLEIEHLKRVNILEAAAVIYPGSDLKEDRLHHDSKVFKILFTCNSYAATNNKAPPLFITEMNEESNMDLIEETGMPHVEVLSTVSIISRLIVQNIRHRYLSFIYNELLSHGTGNQIYIRSCGEFAGNNLAELSLSFPKAILLGIYRNNEAILNAPLDFVIEESDSGIFMAHSHDDTFTFLPKIFDQPISDLELSSLTDVEKQRCILILGWNNKCIEILNEFNSYQNENFTIDILSAVPSEQRQNATRTKFKNLKHASVTHIDADYTSLPLHQLLDLKRYDNILVVANDWLDSDEQVDARSLHGYLRLISSLKKVGHSCDILVELMNGENEKTFPKSRGEILVSPMVISHILAHMTLKPELNEVFEEIFGPLGSEIKFIPALEFGCTPECNFVDIQTLALSRNAIALGIAYCQNGPNFSKPNIYLNPDRRLVFNFGPNDKVIVLDNS